MKVSQNKKVREVRRTSDVTMKVRNLDKSVHINGRQPCEAPPRRATRLLCEARGRVIFQAYFPIRQNRRYQGRHHLLDTTASGQRLNDWTTSEDNSSTGVREYYRSSISIRNERIISVLHGSDETEVQCLHCSNASLFSQVFCSDSLDSTQKAMAHISINAVEETGPLHMDLKGYGFIGAFAGRERTMAVSRKVSCTMT